MLGGKKMDTSDDTFKSANFDGSEDQEKKKTPDTVDVFESIKNDEFEEEEYRRETRKRLIIIIICSIVLILLIVGAVIGVLVPMHTKDGSSISNKEKDTISTICNSTLYRDSCYSSIYSLKMSSTDTSSDPDDPTEVFILSLEVSINELVRLHSSILKRFVSFVKNDTNDHSLTIDALNVCEHLIRDAIDRVNMSLSSSKFDRMDKFSTYVVSDIRTWLSTAITDQQTCVDSLMEFQNISRSLQEEMKADMRNATEFTSNSLAIISNMFTIIPGYHIPVDRKLIQEKDTDSSGWMQSQRRLEVDEMNIRPNLTVAKDGSGDFMTISEAVNAMPRRSSDRFFIYVKKGKYEEKVVVDSDSWNLMIYGDGMKKTIVSGNLNFADGVSTYNSGTFIAEGKGFIAKDMGFKNKAGPAKLQAVALRSSSDRSIFHRCYFDAYQDTLYVHSNRQFYRDCLITGTIDFIFGNAAAIFQNCTIQPRQPGPSQYNVITAQSKSDPNQNTGFSIQHSIISPFDNLTAQTFLGRPWNNFSTTAIMKTDIQSIINPNGWTQWMPNIEVPNTVFYAEYKNNGPGSVLNRRVNWLGYRPNITQVEAEKFSVDPFLQGSQWLLEANVEFNSHI